MAENGLVVIGSRPSSRLDWRSPSAISTTRHLQVNDYNEETPKIHGFSEFRDLSYEDELFGNGASAVECKEDDCYSQISTLTLNEMKKFQKDPSTKTQLDAKTKSTKKPSNPQQSRYSGQEMLHGRTISTRPGLTGARPSPPDSRMSPISHKIFAQTRKSTKKQLLKHCPSYVDETLFGPSATEASFPAPWEKPSDHKPPPLLFDCTDYREKHSSTTRPYNGAKSKNPVAVNRPNSKTRYRATSSIHRNTFIDESLFGDPPLESEWSAPWEKKHTMRKKPLLFDTHNHKVTFEHKTPEY